MYVIIKESMWATQCISSGHITHLLGNYTPSHSVWLTAVRALYPLPLLTTCLPSLQFALYETGCEELDFATDSHVQDGVPGCVRVAFVLIMEWWEVLLILSSQIFERRITSVTGAK